MREDRSGGSQPRERVPGLAKAALGTTGSREGDLAAAKDRGEFERAYAERSGLTVEALRAHGRVVVRCHCLDPGCDGWASVSAEAADDYEPGGIYHVVQSQLGDAAERAAAHYDALADRFPFLRWWYKRRAVAARRIARSEEALGV